MLDMEVRGMEVMAMDMDMVAVATSMWTGNTPTMVSVLPTLTKCQIYILSLMTGLTYNRHHL